VGAKNPEQASEITFASMSMGLLLGLLFMIPAFLTIDIVFTMLGAKPERMELIRDFMHIWYLGMPLQLMQFAGTAVIRATGNARFHGKLMTLTAVRPPARFGTDERVQVRPPDLPPVGGSVGGGVDLGRGGGLGVGGGGLGVGGGGGLRIGR